MSQALLDCLDPCFTHPPTNFAKFAVLTYFGGSMLSAVLSLFTPEGGWRNLFVVLLGCFFLLGLGDVAWSGPHYWFSASLSVCVGMLALVSLVYFPVRSHWVNLPLVAGAVASSALFVTSVVTSSGVPYSTQLEAYHYIDRIELIN